MSEKYIVDGFCFKTEEEANIARNEIDGIEYLMKRTNFNNSANVLAIYDRVIDKELFKTPIGYAFLKDLQQKLYDAEDIDDGMIRGIPVSSSVIVTNSKRKSKVKRERNKRSKGANKTLLPDELEKKYKNRITNLIIVNVFIVIMLVIMLIITNNSENTNILNYRERLDREYTEKENELAIWDQQLKAREQQLNIKESGD